MSNAASMAHLSAAAKHYQQAAKHYKAGAYEKAALSEAMKEMEICHAYENQLVEITRQTSITGMVS